MKQLKFRDVKIGQLFSFPYDPKSKFVGTYKKISPRYFTDGYSKFTCVASAKIERIEDIWMPYA